jgi:MoaA/NifB/PqqE/SkfB family radical SAM enzyme
MTDKEDLIARYKYSAQYVDNYEDFRDKILDKTVVPYQVEFQPPPRSVKKICWLECPYCYGLSAEDTGDRMFKERGIEIMNQIAKGGVKKVIFAGYATDPLNCPYLEDLLEIAIDNQMVFGFNTKALKVSKRLIELLARPDIVETSYMSLSIDAGSNEVYNAIHDVKTTVKLYDRVLSNVRKIADARNSGGAKFDISAAYLVNIHSNESGEVAKFMEDFRSAGCDLLRFTFPQPPRNILTKPGVVPSAQECAEYKERLNPVIEKLRSPACPILLVDADTEHDIFQKPRTVPCFARFVYPTVGFDGWLYHCSQSSSPNFRSMALGDLNSRDFWDVFNDYDASNLTEYFGACSKSMAATGCRCDRKEHVLNSTVIDKRVFKDIIGA